MKKIINFILGAFLWSSTVFAVNATEKFDILPDLPEPLAAAQASSVTTTDSTDAIAHSVGAEPNIASVIISLLFVILLIYACAIIYSKLNKAGIKAFRKHSGDIDNTRVNVLSTTSLGGNKSLHVVELDGKRMLIGASASSIHLIKDLGSYSSLDDFDSTEFSKIEIPNIRIPKIEIPKIEFPNIGFTKTSYNKKDEQSVDKSDNNSTNSNDNNTEDNGFEISEIYEESSDGIIDKLFISNDNSHEENTNNIESEHKINPDEYALYKKYI